MVCVYDIETFGNLFSIVLLDIKTEKSYTFSIWGETNQYNEMMRFLNSCKGLIGFNNLGFDYPVLHEMMRRRHLQYKTGDAAAKEIKQIAQKVIKSSWPNISDKYVKIQQLDLYKVHHFDNKNKATSLKWCEFAMRWRNLQDLPYEHNHMVKANEVKKILDYNLNDVVATYQLYKYSLPKIKLRKSLGTKYGLNFRNANDPKIGSMIFEKLILESNESLNKKKLKTMRTYRQSIAFKDCIFDYVEFENKCFKDLHQYLLKQDITETKGFFTKIPLNKVKGLVPYFNRGSIKKSGKVDNLHIRFKGVDYVYGTGGLHASCDAGIYEIDDEHDIIDIDVASYYPNLAIKNNLFPEHLGIQFCYIYEDVYNTRKVAKDTGDDVTNAGLKLALNGTYGKSNDVNSWLYDPLFTMKITINGQLLMTMLAERLSNISTIIQANTDGVTIHVNKKYRDRVYEICKEWEELTKLTLEYADYKKMIISNVNNYMAVDIKGKIKYKGKAYDIDKSYKGETLYHKDHSSRIVQMAIKRFLIDNIPVEDTIRNHLTRKEEPDDIENHGIFDFCIGKRSRGGKKGKPTMKSRFINDKGILEEKREQGTVRFFIAKKGVHLIKKYDDGSETQVIVHPQKGRMYKIQMFNDYYNSTDYNIDYSYYIREANKVINEVISHNQTLF